MLREPHNQPDPEISGRLPKTNRADEPVPSSGEVVDQVEQTVNQAPWLVRGLFQTAGWIAVGLAVLGIPLPVLPTTPFLLLAAGCFARSSPELHQRLIEHKRLGPILSQWNDDRTVTPAVKRRAILMTTGSFAISIWIVNALATRIVLASVCFGVVLFLARFRTSETGLAMSDVTKET